MIVIGEALIELFLSIMRLLFGAIEVISLPFDLIGVLANILVYGNWIIGIDLLGIFVGTVVFWWAVHLSVGFAIWVWERLPLT